VRGRAGGNGLAVTQGSAAVTYSPAYAYVMDYGTGSVSGFAVDPATGGLSVLSGNPVATGSRPTGMAVDPAGRFAFVVNKASSTISAFTIDGSGNFQPNGAPLATDASPYDVAVDPSGRFAVVSTKSSTDLLVYGIDPSAFSLTLKGRYADTHANAAIAIDPTGRFLFAAGPGSLSVFAIDPSAGTLTQPSGATVSTGPDPYQVLADPSGRYLYVANGGIGSGGDAVYLYTIDPGTGAPAANSTAVFNNWSPNADNLGLSGLAVNPAGNLLFAPFYGLAGTAFIWGWTLGPDGLLTSLGTLERDHLYQNRYAAVDPSGQFLLVAIANGSILDTFRIAPGTGALTPLATATGAPSSGSIPGNQSTLAVTGVIH